MKKVGFLGGTFNPIHTGHLRIAIEVMEKCNLENIHFVPAFVPVHKKDAHILSFNTRADLINLAIEEYNLQDKFSVSTHESTLETASYTYFSLQKWQENNGVKPYFIVGLEDFIKLDTWHNSKDLPKFANFIVVKRAHYSIEDFHNIINTLWSNEAIRKADNIYQIYDSSIEFIETSRLDISSSAIRKALYKNQDTTCLLAKKVENALKQDKEFCDLLNKEFSN